MLLLFVFWCESFHLQTASQCVKRNPAKAATSCNGRRPGCSSWNDGLLLLLSKTHKQKQIILICFKQNAEKQALQRPWKSTEMYQCKTVLHQNSIVFSIKEEIEKTNYVRKLQRKGFHCQEKEKKGLSSSKVLLRPQFYYLLHCEQIAHKIHYTHILGTPRRHL